MTAHQFDLTEAASTRPRTRAECPKKAEGAAHVACPWASCRHHLAVYATREQPTWRGAVRAPRFKLVEPVFDEDGVIDLSGNVATCSLDVADEDGATLDRIGDILGVSRERVRQIEQKALRSARAVARRLGLGYMTEALDQLECEVDRREAANPRRDEAPRVGCKIKR